MMFSFPCSSHYRPPFAPPPYLHHPLTSLWADTGRCHGVLLASGVWLMENKSKSCITTVHLSGTWGLTWLLPPPQRTDMLAPNEWILNLNCENVSLVILYLWPLVQLGATSETFNCGSIWHHRGHIRPWWCHLDHRYLNDAWHNGQPGVKQVPPLHLFSILTRNICKST